MALLESLNLKRTVAPIAAALARFSSGYEVRMATSPDECLAAFRLRYEVFNQELGEGLAASHSTGLDRDAFDESMHHLVVFERESGQAVGTYRMQTGAMARDGLGFYSAQEFDFTPFLPVEDQLLELGRACIHRQHRKATVILLLWQAVADFARSHGCRYLIGCSSLTSQDPVVGKTAWQQLVSAGHVVLPEFRTTPQPEYRLPEGLSSGAPIGTIKLPRLLRAYLGVGAKICGPPAMDRAFGTVDFLTLLDLAATNPAASGHFLKTLEK